MSAYLFVRFLREENGATAVEYGLLVGLLSLGVMAIMAVMGTTIGDLFAYVGGIFADRANALN